MRLVISRVEHLSDSALHRIHHVHPDSHTAAIGYDDIIVVNVCISHLTIS
jgi:hypothetical protein